MDIQKKRREHFLSMFKESESDNIQKSDIMGALSYDHPVIISKSGKEIKNQVDSVLLPDLNSKLSELESKASEKLEDCGDAPFHDVDKWWTCDVKIDIGYKVYSWPETDFCEHRNGIADSLSTYDSKDEQKKMNPAKSREEAAARMEYNDIIHRICDVKVDIMACNVLKSLEDGKKYDLTPKQILALKF